MPSFWMRFLALLDHSFWQLQQGKKGCERAASERKYLAKYRLSMNNVLGHTLRLRSEEKSIVPVDDFEHPVVSQMFGFKAATLCPTWQSHVPLSAEDFLPVLLN